MHDFGDFENRLERAGLIIRRHDRHQRGRAAVEHATELIEVDDAGTGDPDGADSVC